MTFEQFTEALTKGASNSFDIGNADLFVVNDAYRMTPTAAVLDWLDESGRLNDRARFLIATGCHGEPNEAQMEKIFGPLLDRIRDRILVHDADDYSMMAEAGRDDDGAPVYLNRYLLGAERVVVIGSVEPHYFAGYTGGRKSIFPGLCDFETTVRNHNRAVSFEAAPMRLEGNPVEEDLERLMRFFPVEKVFSIQLVMAAEDNIQAVFAGGLDDTFRGACEAAGKIYGKNVPHDYELVLAEARPPLDASLYQLQKSLENCQGAVADGGTVILFSPCREGVGSEGFYRLAESWQPSDDALPEGRESFGRHKLYRVYKIGKRIDIYLYSELDEGVADKVYFRSTVDPQGLIDKLTRSGGKVRTALVRDSGQTVLVN